MWVAFLASALHDEMCSLDDECALERYRWAEDTYRCMYMHLMHLLYKPCMLYRSRGEDRGMSLAWVSAGKDACARRWMAGVQNSKRRGHAETDFLASRQIHHDEISECRL